MANKCEDLPVLCCFFYFKQWTWCLEINIGGYRRFPIQTGRWSVLEDYVPEPCMPDTDTNYIFRLRLRRKLQESMPNIELIPIPLQEQKIRMASQPEDKKQIPGRWYQGYTRKQIPYQINKQLSKYSIRFPL